MKLINEHTGISIGLLISIIGGVFWLSTIYSKAEATGQAVIRLEDKQEQYNQHVIEINKRLGRIEGKLGVGR